MTVPNTQPSAADLDSLEKVARQATPGPWHREMIELGHGGPMTLGVGSPTDPICIVNGIVESPLGNRNVRYLVGFNPAVALTLIAEIRRLRSALEGQTWTPVSSAEEHPVPEVDKAILVRKADWPDGSACMGKLNDETGMWESEETDDDGSPRWSYGRFEVSHWCAIPSAPKESP